MRLFTALLLALVVSATALAAVPVALDTAPTAFGATAPVTLVGAGDIAVCGSITSDTRTAQLVQDILLADATASAFTLGDNVYPDGSSNWFSSCYEPTWGAFKARTHPVPGNHDYYNNPNGEGYFGYFGALAGPTGRGWYRYDAGAWRVYALSSECIRGSRCYIRQYRWLRADLVNNPHQCVLAMWHRPRFSTGEHGSSTRMAPVFDLLYDHGAEIVLSGHDHNYERFAPTAPNGNPDPTNGLRQWVVGTGGAPIRPFEADALPITESRDSTAHGVLRLDLYAGGYDWQFMTTSNNPFTDTGSAACH
ncbi:MAG: acid phosphatase type 7 [Chloroflexota bacterium]|jgi:3',5'-cyclic AMP phosphodiesterase CpdA|nr:acid phosphatase type 7 [Chloroflexota bacterium]